VTPPRRELLARRAQLADLIRRVEADKHQPPGVGVLRSSIRRVVDVALAGGIVSAADLNDLITACRELGEWRVANAGVDAYAHQRADWAAFLKRWRDDGPHQPTRPRPPPPNQATAIPWPDEQPTVALWPTAARAYGIGRTTAYRLAAAGGLPVPAELLGGRWIVRTAQLRRALGLPVTAPPRQ